MDYTSKQLPYSKPTLIKKGFGILLILAALALLANPIYQTFFYKLGANESPMGLWDTVLMWGVSIVLGLIAGFYGFVLWIMGGGAGKLLSSDPDDRVAAISPDKNRSTLVQMAMTDPVPRVRQAAIDALPLEELEAAYEHVRCHDGFDCPELEEAVQERGRASLLDKASTVEGFLDLSKAERDQVMAELPTKNLVQYFTRADDSARMAILKRVENANFRRQVARNDRLSAELRSLAANLLDSADEYALQLNAKDPVLREKAAQWLIRNKHYDKLRAHLPSETDQGVCKTLVDGLGQDEALDALGDNPSKASASVIIDACQDQEALERTAKVQGLESWINDKIDNRLETLRKKSEADARAKAKALEKIRTAKEAQKTAKDEAHKLSESTDKKQIFSIIENVRAPRINRVAATVALSKLLPECAIGVNPGTQRAFHCPDCATVGDAIMKPTGWEAMEAQMERGGMIAGGASCPQCGKAQSYTDILSGKFDVVMVNIECPHCGNPMNGPIESWLNCECMKCGKVVIKR